MTVMAVWPQVFSLPRKKNVFPRHRRDGDKLPSRVGAVRPRKARDKALRRYVHQANWPGIVRFYRIQPWSTFPHPIIPTNFYGVGAPKKGMGWAIYFTLPI